MSRSDNDKSPIGGGDLTLTDVVGRGGGANSEEERELRKRPKILDELGVGVELIVVVDS
jgi:hypothetical protein